MKTETAQEKEIVKDESTKAEAQPQGEPEAIETAEGTMGSESVQETTEGSETAEGESTEGTETEPEKIEESPLKKEESETTDAEQAREIKMPPIFKRDEAQAPAEKIFNNAEIRKMLENGEIDEDTADELRARRIAKEENRETRQQIEIQNQNSLVWNHMVNIFPEFKDTDSSAYKKLAEIYHSDPFLKSDPRGQFYAAAFTKLLLIGNNIGQVKATARKQALEERKIISKVHSESPTNSIISQKSKLTPDQKKSAQAKGWSDEEYLHWSNPNQNKPFVKKK